MPVETDALVTASGHEAESPAYLQPGVYVDSDHPAVVEFAHRVADREPGATGRAVALYHAIRDDFRYDPYRVDLEPAAMRASAVLERGYAFCIPKAALLAAAGRVHGIPTRLGFADVKNHLATPKLLKLMQTDVFAYHGYAELYLEGKWVKATPAFNASLCERFDVPPLPFDGRTDSIFQEFDRQGNRYMEYIRDHGQFADVPLDQIVEAFRAYYPALMARAGYAVSGDFEGEARPASAS